MANAPDEAAASEDLYFSSHNPSSPKTVVLLHGLFCSHLEWEHVVPHLEGYHLIVPDLPQHSRSRAIRPFSLGLAADKVASLIERHAHGGTAHVVGMSLGGFVAMDLIRRHAALVDSAFVAGAAPFRPWQVWAAQRATALHWVLRAVEKSGIERVVAWQSGMKPHDQMQKEAAANKEASLVRDAYRELSMWQYEDVKSVGALDKRILAVAGGKVDSAEATKQMGDILKQQGREGGKETRAAVVQKAIHEWNLQYPELFADGVKAWVENQPLPEEFEILT
ncbi:hypothetical protein AK830_g9123 [Neonectria ditissima]|uniref:AB hydrolase-1 domain-containing protein n=1 Tax=Neonectria ditissima TaxID=78410 RepID=A0A0N8H5X9_9HYPO|nr:hypothetical protein AK830_g9123 [Neonectria ditissima]